MRAITIRQPYAAGVALEIKRFETRSWRTQYRGPLAIHAGTPPAAPWGRWPDGRMEWDMRNAGIFGTGPSFALGAIVAVCDLVAIHRTEDLVDVVSERERRWGDWRPGRFAWELQFVLALQEPIPCRGRQGLFPLPDDVLAWPPPACDASPPRKGFRAAHGAAAQRAGEIAWT